jgi:hypothetical protein
MADRKISDLTALSTPASGDYLPIVDISEAAAASKNKRITIEELFRGVPLGTAAAPSIAIEGDEDTGIYSPGANQLAVATNSTERMRFTSDAYVRLAAGTGGIQFNGDTAAANALDDYEEGSCTLLVSDSLGNDATADINNDQQYTKIGRKVTVTGTLTWSSTAALAADSRIKITGLPFAAVGSLGSVRAPAIFGSSTSGSFNITRSEIAFGVDPGQTFLFGTKLSGNNVDDIMVKADLGTSGILFGIQITYFTA